MTSINTSGAASMMPKAFFTGREIGATTARALTLRITGVVPLIFVSSLDTVPSPETRGRPVGCRRLHQPAPGISSRECDPLRLPCLDCQRIQPKRLPAIVEPVQQPEMMPMQVEDGRDISSVCQGQHHGSAGFGPEHRPN